MYDIGKLPFALVLSLCLCLGCKNPQSGNQSAVPKPPKVTDSVLIQDLVFASAGVELAGTMFIPDQPQAALVLVHGSDKTPRMTELGKFLAQNDMLVLTYDKRGIGESGGVYAGPEVGTNNISTENLNLLAQDANAAVATLKNFNADLPLGLLGFSQAGWIIPIAADRNKQIDFMALFSCPTITTLEQLRFQFYTNGDADFWNTHNEADAREHLYNDPDRYHFAPTDPKMSLRNLSIPGLWLFGEKDIQIPVKVCIEQLNIFRKEGKPFEYLLFPELGHNTNKTEPREIALNWIKRQASAIQNSN